MQRNRLRRLRSHVILLATTLLLVVQMGGALQAAPAGAGRAAVSNQRPGEGRLIPIEEQPFFPELEAIAAGWSDVVLDQVVGDSPRATLLNFYAVMAEVGRRADRLGRVTSLARSDAQAQERREQIDDTSLLFQLAVKALDASVFPESVRNDMADEAAIQLKHVLDYVFTHSHQPIVIPDAAGMKTINDERTKPADAWRIPGTAITLTTEVSNDPGNHDYLFSADTVAAISEMYQEIRDFPVVDQPFATPVFYRDFVYTPGYLVPPAWYLALPRNVRDLIEVPISDQTLFQIACAALAIVLSLLFLAWLGSFMLQTYRERASQAPEGDPWNQDRLAWRRVLIVLPILPLTRFTEVFIDDVVNFTGLPLAVITYALYVIWYLTAGVFMFFVFEAVGWRHPAAAATGQQSGDAPLPRHRRPGGRGVGLPLVAASRTALEHRARLLGRARSGHRSGRLEIARQSVRRPLDSDRSAPAGRRVLPGRRQPGLRDPDRAALARTGNARKSRHHPQLGGG